MSTDTSPARWDGSGKMTGAVIGLGLGALIGGGGAAFLGIPIAIFGSRLAGGAVIAAGAGVGAVIGAATWHADEHARDRWIEHQKQDRGTSITDLARELRTGDDDVIEIDNEKYLRFLSYGTHTQTRDATAAFRTMDTSGDGTVTRHEIARMMARFDDNGSGGLDLDEHGEYKSWLYESTTSVPTD